MDFHTMSAISLHLPQVKFCKKSSRSAQNEGSADLLVTPLVVDFGRLLKTANKTYEELVPGIPNSDLLHATASLYGTSLSEITNDIIYPILCEKWSKSILMILDEKQAEEKLKKRMMKSSKTDEDVKVEQRDASSTSLCKRREQIQKLEEAERSVDIFSDDDLDDSEDDDEEDDNFLDGIDAFLRSVDERREAREKWIKMFHNGETTQSSLPLGIENRLIGCMTFERSYERPGEKVVQLTLIAVRKKYRALGIGSYLIKHIMDPSITGGSDVIVVNADHNAVDFFERHGFTDDVILNSRYAHIGDVWFNSKRMCFMEEYSRGNHHHTESFFNLREMELQISMWKEKSVQAYQQFASIVQRMRREILTLHARIELQDENAARLQKQLDERSVELEQAELRRRIGNLQSAIDSLHEKEIESIMTSSSAHDIGSSSSSATIIAERSPSKDDAMSAHETPSDAFAVTHTSQQDDVVLTSEVDDDIRLLAQFAGACYKTTIPPTSGDGSCLSQSGRTRKTPDNHSSLADCVNQTLSEIGKTPAGKDGSNQISSTSSSPTADSSLISGPPQSSMTPSLEDEIHSLFLHKIKHCFLVSISEAESSNDVNVLDVTPASLPLGITSRFNEAIQRSRDPDIVATLYFCGPSERSGDSDGFKRILTRGFGMEDFAESDYGKGLHFSRHAKCAAHFSPSGQIIVAKVSLGRTQTITAKKPDCKQPPDGFDSIITQGRFSSQTPSRLNVTGHSEYVVFRHDQAMPIALIHYTLLR